MFIKNGRNKKMVARYSGGTRFGRGGGGLAV